MAEGDYVIVHGHFSGFGQPVNWIATDIVRIKDGVLAEHWDVIQDKASRQESKSGLPMLATASVNEVVPTIESVLGEFVESLHTNGKKDWVNIFGYGIGDYQRATYSDQFSVVLCYKEAIPADSIFFLAGC